MSRLHGLHPLEVTAHTVLSGPLDSLGNSLERLGTSQVTLFTRLRLLQDILSRYDQAARDAPTEKDLARVSERIRGLRKRLAATVKSLEQTDKKVDSLLESLDS